MSTWYCVIIIVSTISSCASVPVPQNNDEKETYDRDYWYAEAQRALKKRLQYAPENNPVAKNIIFAIGDGMSLTTTTAARIMRGQRSGQSGEDTNLIWDTFPAVALAKTYNIDAQTGESSACATALLCGVKARFETLGLDARGRFNNCTSTIISKVTSLIDWAHREGKSSGVVTTARVTHATPAAAYANAPSRYWEDDSRVPPTVRQKCKDIALQLVENEPGRSINVIMGGGRRHFLPTMSSDPQHKNHKGKRLDGRNLAEDWVRDKKKRRLRAQYIFSKEQLFKIDSRNTDFLLGLFEYSHLEFNADQKKYLDSDDKDSTNKTEDPTLADMTRTALSILTKYRKGFVLVIEGGRIDHGHHNNNPYRALDETLELETAILVALEKVNPADTLIVVTADHGHVMTFGGLGTPKGHPIIGADPIPSDIDDLHYTTLLYGTGPGHSEPRTLPVNETLISPNDVAHAAAAPRQWATHGAEDVPIYALGPMATVLFTGVVEQSYIPHAIAYAACLAHQSHRCMETNIVKVQTQTCNLKELTSMSAAEEKGDRTTSKSVVVASGVISDDATNRSTAQFITPIVIINYLNLFCLLNLQNL